MRSTTGRSSECGERATLRGLGSHGNGLETKARSAARHVAEVMRRVLATAPTVVAVLAGLVATAADAGPRWQRVQLRSNLEFHSAIGGLAVSPDDRFLWAITGNAAEGREVRVVSIRLRREVARYKLPDSPRWFGDSAWGRTATSVLAGWPYGEGVSVFLFDARQLDRWLAGGRQPRPRELRLPRTDAAGYPPSDTCSLAVSPGEKWLSLVADRCDPQAIATLSGGVLLVERTTDVPTSVAIPGTSCCSDASFASDNELDLLCQSPTSERPRWYFVRRQGRTWSVATSRQLGAGAVPHPNDHPSNPTRDSQGRLWLSWFVRNSGDIPPTGVLEVADPQRGSLSLAVRSAIGRIHLRDSSYAWIALTDGSVQEVRVLPGPAPRLSLTREIVPAPPAGKDSFLATMAIGKSGRLFVTGEGGGSREGATLWLWERPPAERRRKR
jgi:hypothetical protein